MRTLFFSLLCLVTMLKSHGQKKVDIDNLNFIRTKNFNLIYTEYSATTKLAVNTHPNQKVFLDIGSGYTEVYASENNMLIVEAEIIILCMNENKIKKLVNEKLNLSIEKTDKLIRLTSAFKHDDRDGKIVGDFFSSPDRRINLKIYLPSYLSVKAIDGPGDFFVKNIKNDLILDDGSGAINIDGLEGNLTLFDNSGGITLKNINTEFRVDAELNIEDNSGPIYLSNVLGKANINDTSGDIEISSLHGSLNIKDTSGRIVCSDIIGDSKVEDASGEIHIAEADGNITLYDNSGGIYIVEVSKDIYLKSNGSGVFETKNVRGSIYKN